MMRLSVLVRSIVLAVATSCRGPTSNAPIDEWLTVGADGISIRADSALVPFVRDAILNGDRIATTFFTAAPLQPYAISIYPDRTSLTDHWLVAWQFPSFQAECWMIAAAWATELDLLSPRSWSRDACGHNASNTTHSRNVLAHEVVHVRHGQMGQHGSLGSMAEVWSDQASYPPSESIVRYIDRHFGRAALRSLLDARSSSTILTRLGIGEAELLTAWRTDP